MVVFALQSEITIAIKLKKTQAALDIAYIV